jgi:hypothetical protein
VVAVFLYNNLAVAEFVEVTRPPTVSKLVVPGPEDSVGIVCEVNVPKGTSDEEPQFQVWWNAETLRSEGGQGGQAVWKLGENKYRVTATHPAKDAAPVRVTAKFHRLGSLSHPITRVDGEKVTFDFQASAAVKLSISGMTEDLRKGLRATCGGGGTVAEAMASYSATSVIKDKIMLQLPPMQPGTLSIALQSFAGGPSIVTTSVSVAAAEEKVLEMEIPPLFELTVQADEDNRWGELLWESPSPHSRMSLRFDGLGKAVVRYLPAGTYTLRYRLDRDVRERKVAVASDTTVHLRD